MKLPHLIGGLEGLDEVPLEYEKRVFVAEWEKRIFGIHHALLALSSTLRNSLPGYDVDSLQTSFSGQWTAAHLRQRMEAVDPISYFQFRFYEKWLSVITEYLIEQDYIDGDGLVSAVECFTKDPDRPLPARPDQEIDDHVIRYLREGDSPRRGPATPIFATGERVEVRNPPMGDHTRLPGYLRGQVGVVERIFEGNYAYPISTGADGLGVPMPVYLVRFERSELWGKDVEPLAEPLFAELYETYLLKTTRKDRGDDE